MRKWFPEMYDRPDNGPVVASILYWIVCFFVIPCVTLIFAWAFRTDLTAVIGVDIATYVVNFIAMLSLFHSYLGDSFWNIHNDRPGFIKTVALASLAILTLEVNFLILGPALGGLSADYSYPISETSVIAPAYAVVVINPLLGTLCMALLTPFTVSCMYYATVFAPIASRRPALAYFVTAVALLFPRLLSNWLLQSGLYDVGIYLTQLPIHLIACWSYQKTNSIWAPIFSLAVTNLLFILLFLL